MFNHRGVRGQKHLEQRLYLLIIIDKDISLIIYVEHSKFTLNFTLIKQCFGIYYASIFCSSASKKSRELSDTCRAG